MLRFILRRLLIIPFLVLLANFLGFAYAYLALYVQRSQSPYGSPMEGLPPILGVYKTYLQNALYLDFGTMPVGVTETVASSIAKASLASLGLLGIAFFFSILIGLILGLGAVRPEAGVIARWLTPISVIGLATPSFYIGTLFIVASVFYIMRSGPDIRPPIPLFGYGWDAHLIIPVLALSLRPTMQIARMTATMLNEEMGKQYIITSRAFGRTWRAIRWKHALRNILAAVLTTIAGSFRLMVGELILVEWLFSWPGMGRLLALALIPPRFALPGSLSGMTAYFLNPPLFAALLSVFTFIFIISDTVSTTIARSADPRLRAIEVKQDYD